MSRGRRVARWMNICLAVLALSLVTVVLLSHVRHPRSPASSPAAAQKPAAPSTPALPHTYRVLALGDSVPAGSACTCPAFPELYGRQLASRIGAPVHVHNDGVPRETSGMLRSALQRAPTKRDVANADVVVVTIGANDFAFQTYEQHQCGGLSCYAPGLKRLRSNLTETFDTIRGIAPQRPRLLLATGYWDIWRDGAVARRLGRTYVRVGDALTRRVNNVIATAAASSAFRYVDLFTPFRGASGQDDDTGLLAADGDHPNRAGHRLIAAELVRQGGTTLSRD